MTINQLSVFVENKPGKIAAITRLIADAKLDLRALSVADTADFGILRMIVDDTEKALAALKAAGYVVSATEIVAVRLPDVPGALARLLGMLAENAVNIEYMYAFFTHTRDYSYMALRVTDVRLALGVLEEIGYPTVSSAELGLK